MSCLLTLRKENSVFVSGVVFLICLEFFCQALRPWGVSGPQPRFIDYSHEGWIHGGGWKIAVDEELKYSIIYTMYEEEGGMSEETLQQGPL